MHRTFCCILLCACTPSQPNLSDCESLSGDAIKRRFSNVIDSAVVYDANGGRATNHWFADGRFTSEWSTHDGSGALVGTWHVEGDLRCVVLQGDVPDGKDGKRCGPLFQCGRTIVSVNVDGSIHGVHRLKEQ